MPAALPIARHLAALLSFGAMSVAMTWPLATHLGTHVIRAKWHYDAMVNLMILGSRMHWLLGIGNLQSVYDNYFCAPVPLSIANNENLFGLSLLYAPFFIVTRDPLLSYNLLLLTCLTLSGFFSYLLVRRLGGSAQAGVVCGAAFAFCPYVFFEAGRVQLVATQWIPLCALLLHDAVETGRWRSMLGLFVAYAMQVGSCLYYAVFLAVYFAAIGPWLMLRHGRFSLDFLRKLVVGSVLGAALIIPAVYPHFKAREDFPLTRTESKARDYSGKPSYLFRVYPENKSLPFLYDTAHGPHEPIAFPGFMLTTFALVAFLGPIARRFRGSERGLPRKLVVLGAAIGPLAFFGAMGFGLMFGNLALGLPVFLGAVWLWKAIRSEPLLPPERAAYAMLWVLAFVLFLGPYPFKLDAIRIVGLYHYLYEFVPGFDGIRYVSRFAALLMLVLLVLGGWGATKLLSFPKTPRTRAIAFLVSLGLVLFELRNAPVSLAEIPNLHDLSPAYAWLGEHEGPEPLAILPAYPKGRQGARNDYIALFHKRRAINGKSSWMPPITNFYIRESRRFPSRSGTQLLKILGVKYLLLHTEEYSFQRAEGLLQWLDAQSHEFRLAFSSGSHYVYELIGDHKGMRLRETPKLPADLKRVSRTDMLALASRYAAQAALAIDGDPKTRWTTRRVQQPGDSFEIRFDRETNLAGFDMHDFESPFEAPLSFRVSVAQGDGRFVDVLTRSDLTLFRDQVFHPNSFIFRVLFDRPVKARSLRIELMGDAAGDWWSIHEMVVWEK